MPDPIFSPDGKFMWTGSEWIPAPPSSNPAPQSIIDLTDSMMSGDVNVKQGSGNAASSIHLKDSSMSGDINITQTFDADNIVKGLSDELKSSFDPNFRYKVPTTGLSKTSVEMVIDKIKIDPKVLQNFSLDELYDFCKQLLLMGRLNNVEYCTPYLIQRAHNSGDKSMICMSKLLVSDIHTQRYEFSKAEAYALSAMEIASKHELVAEKMASIMNLSSLYALQLKDSQNWVKSAEDLIGKEDAPLDALVWANLLLADHTDGPESENHEIIAFNLAKQIGDLELMGFAVIYAMENETHTLEEDEIKSVVNQLQLAGYDLIANLVGLLEVVLRGEQSSYARAQMKAQKMMEMAKKEKCWELYVPLILNWHLTNIDSLFDSTEFDWVNPDYKFLDAIFYDEDLEFVMNLAVESNAALPSEKFISVILNISLYFFYPLPPHVERFVSSFSITSGVGATGYKIVQLIHSSIKGHDSRHCDEVFEEINGLINQLNEELNINFMEDAGFLAACVSLYEANWIKPHQDSWRFEGMNRLRDGI